MRIKTLLGCVGLIFALSASWASADVFGDVPEASSYQLVYSLNIPDSAAFGTTGVPAYSTDNHAAISQPFDRIAYYLELQSNAPNSPLEYVYASMNAFTTDPSRIGVPTYSSNEYYQRPIYQMNVVSNVPGLTTGTNLSGGNIEFWPMDYGPSNSAGVAGASNSTYDFGDQASPGGSYGSMQIHNHAAGQTLFAYNQWGGDVPSQNSDLGIGNNPAASANPDWTVSYNAGSYSVKTMEVLVHAGTPAVPPPVHLQIMPLGDSITNGYNAAANAMGGGYRTKLAANLTNAGSDFRFVGSAQTNPSADLNNTGQMFHEGHNGYTIGQIQNNLTGNDGTLGNNGGNWLNPSIQPDIILLHIGTNDIFGGGADAATTGKRLDALIEQLVTDRPNAHLLVASIIPSTDTAHNATIRAYDDEIQNTIVPKYQAEGKLVTFVDQYDNFINPDGSVNASLFSDSVHPNQTGYDLMADTWFNSIQSVPEPATAALLLLALPVLWSRSRRERGLKEVTRQHP